MQGAPSRCSSPCRARPAGQRGFSLVELMYAVGFFMFGLTGLATFQIVGNYGAGRAADISQATNLAAATVEATKVQLPTKILALAQPMLSYYDRFGQQLSGPAGAFFTISAQATPVTQASYYELWVNCSWKQTPVDTLVHNIDLYTRIPIQ